MVLASPYKQLQWERRYHRTKDHALDLVEDLWDRFKLHVVLGTTTSMEFFMLFATMLSGLWLLLPFGTFGTRGGYEVMDELGRVVLTVIGLDSYLATEAVWGVVLLVNTLIWAKAISEDSEHLRRVAAMMSIVIWSFIAACFMLVNFRFLSSVVYPYYTIVCVWLYLRACR